MANTFKNAAAASTGTSEVAVYTVGSGTTSTVIGLTCANTTTTSPIKVSIKFFDASASANFFIVKNAEIFEGGALVAVGGDQKLVLETGDKIKVVSDTASSVDTIVSVLEQT
jgi:hypothetical protein|tara:strand:+ start:551 stop:886 length:336 start_codon:yes stop_codon:yes gene_type:complete